MTTSPGRIHHDDDTKLMQAQIRFLENETRALRETLRDRFAMAAMQGFVTNHDERRSDLIDVPQLAKSAYKVADAMLEARG